jgi:glycerophosphoryl diester phosphodiesterase
LPWPATAWLLVVAVLAFSGPAAAFDLQAHRGGRGLLPENTLAAFSNAARMGVTTLEMDVAITADGVAVVSHDPALSPALARDAQGQWLKSPVLIRSLTLAQLQTYDVGRLNPDHAYGKSFGQQQPRDGQRVPTLAAVFQRVKEMGAAELQFDIETKVFPNRPDDTAAPEVFVRSMLAVIREAGMVERVTIQSFDWRTLKMVQAAEPRIRTVYLTTQGGSGGGNVADPAWTAGMLLRDHASVAHMVQAAGGSTWAPNFKDLDEPALRSAQALGLRVVPWTVNDPADLRRLLGWGVDGIITDYPDRLRDAMLERGMALPARSTR